MKRISLLVVFIIAITACGKDKKNSPVVDNNRIKPIADTDYARGFITEAKNRLTNKEYGEAYRYVYIMVKNYPASPHIEETQKLFDEIFKYADTKDLFKISTFLTEEEDYEAAINVLEHIYQKSQKPSVRADALYYKGLHYERINRIDDMEKTWMKLSNEFPESSWAAEVLYGLAFTIYQKTNSPEKTKPYLSLLYKRFPRSKWGLEGKGLEKSWSK